MSERAEVQALQAQDWIAERDQEQADLWFRDLQAALRSLQKYPARCALAPESRFFVYEVRQLVFGDYRILFRVESDRVFVLHIRHGERSSLSPDEIGGEHPAP